MVFVNFLILFLNIPLFWSGICSC